MAGACCVMKKNMFSIVGAGLLSLFSGCSSIDKDSKFVYPDVVQNLEHRNRHYSLENVVMQKDVLYAGASAVKITPQNNVYLAGFRSNRKSVGVDDDLFARCVVL